MTTRILVADDHPLFRSALKLAVAQISADFDLVEACNIRQAQSHLQDTPFISLVLLDLKMPDCSGMEGLLTLRAQFPYVPVVIVSASEDRQQMRKALALGASGYIPKSVSMDALTGALKSILEGEVWIPPGVDLDQESSPERFSAVTPAQLRILLDLQRGRLNKQIAFDAGVTEATVKAHLTVIFKKLGVANRTQAVLAIQAQTDLGDVGRGASIFAAKGKPLDQPQSDEDDRGGHADLAVAGRQADHEGRKAHQQHRNEEGILAATGRRAARNTTAPSGLTAKPAAKAARARR